MSKQKVCRYCKLDYTLGCDNQVYCSDKCRFFSKIEKTEACWNWTAGLDAAGYGQFSVGHRGYRAHRYSWILHRGTIRKNIFVCHKCDNPKCVNPDHLFSGTQKANMKDKTKKGRAQKGEKCYNSKLTIGQVADIINDKRIYKQIAAEYNVSKSLITKIKCGNAWAHVKVKRIKKRVAIGEQASKAKLTEQQVLAIRADTRNYKEVIAEYDISNSTYYAIRAKQYWKHI